MIYEDTEREIDSFFQRTTDNSTRLILNLIHFVRLISVTPTWSLVHEMVGWKLSLFNVSAAKMQMERRPFFFLDKWYFPVFLICIWHEHKGQYFNRSNSAISAAILHLIRLPWQLYPLVCCNVH